MDMGLISKSATTKLILSVISCLVVLGTTVSGHRLSDYMIQDDLSDGQHEIRIHYEGVSAKQTSVGHQQGSDSGLVLRQVSRHKHLVTLIYLGEVEDGLAVEDLSLRDCEITSDPLQVDTFLESFRQDVEFAQTIQQGSTNGVFFNTSYVPLTSQDVIPDYLKPALNFRELRALCKSHHRSVRRSVKQKRRLDNADKKANQVDLEEDKKFHSSRSRRSVLDNLRFPATRWCGVGYSASVYGDLGGASGADKCCRQHDLHCPYYIKSFEKKYGIMNWSIGTINHCVCDERFRACLKMSKTGAADMVGNVFFDVVKTRCFVFKKEKVCKKWSWWGRCEKYRLQSVAVLRDPIPFST
uniref:Putative phospholipase A2 n=1 Tax=Crangon crangon TaxID=491138 RepID=A0A2Z4BW50_CRACN|nr:putative phospholipase A2 [Crangon crangon]